MKYTPSSLSRRTILIIIAFVFAMLGLFTFYIYPTFIFSRPLGDKLEYIGKTDYGCWLVCDSNPASVYYYATDMNVEEVIGYFKKTSVVEKPSTIDSETYFGIKAPSGETIYMYYFRDKQNTKIQRLRNLRGSTKRHVLTLPSFKYEVAQSLL